MDSFAKHLKHLLMKRAVIIILILSVQIMQSQNISTDRPDQTESSKTLDKGSFQLESGLVLLKDNDANFRSFAAPSNLIRYGIFNGFELRFMTQHESVTHELEGGNRKYSGLNDLELGFKVQLFQKEDSNTEIAFLSHIILPTASKGLGHDKAGLINKLAIAHELSESIGLGYNLGYDHIDSNHFFTYSVALGLTISESLACYIEPYGSLGASGYFENNFDFGITVLLNPNFQLDTSYGFGLNNDVHYLSAGFSWHVPHLFSKN